ncbi:hypothetical protein FAGKG844_120014 [Frankia sp. AgKG'84/4]
MRRTLVMVMVTVAADAAGQHEPVVGGPVAVSIVRLRPVIERGDDQKWRPVVRSGGRW